MKAIEVTVCHRPDDTRIYHKYVKSLLNEGYEVLYIAPSNFIKPNNRITPLSINQSNFVMIRLMRLIFLIPKMLKFKSNFIHIHDPELLLLCPIFKILRFKVIYDMHENFVKELDDKPISSVNKFFQKAVWNFLENFVLKNVNVVFAEVSYKKYFPEHKDNPAIQNFPTKENYLNLCAPSKYPNQIPKFVYLGTITEDRGALKTIRCLKNAFADGNYELHFIGDIPNKIFEVEFRKEIKGNKNIIFHGFQQGKKKIQICTACDVGLAILDSRDNYIESYPTKIFEYIVCGLPIITSNFDLYKSVVNLNKIGICVDPMNEDDITNAFKKILSLDEYATYSNGVRNFPTSNFIWESEFMKFMQFAKGLL